MLLDFAKVFDSVSKTPSKICRFIVNDEILYNWDNRAYTNRDQVFIVNICASAESKT